MAICGAADAIAGFAISLAYGMLMGVSGMLPIEGMLVRQDSALVGFGVHMAVSAAFGALYGLAVPFARGPAVATGVVYGVMWWVLGALVLMYLNDRE